MAFIGEAVQSQDYPQLDPTLSYLQRTVLVFVKWVILAWLTVIVAIFYTESESRTDTDDLLFRKAGEYDLEYVEDNILAIDLDSDGWVDLLTIGGPYRGPYTFSVLFNNGDGTFSYGASYEVSSVYIAGADFDRDGDVDLAARTGPRSPKGPYLMIFFNDGEGTFRQGEERYHLKDWGYDILSDDLDGDGDPDVAVAGEERIDLFFNDGKGSFPTRGAIDHEIEGEVRIFYYFLLGADFDGDRDLDLVYVADDISGMAVGYPSEFQVQFNDGQGSFSEPVIYSNQNAKALLPLVGDFNGDGHTDVCALARFLDPSPFNPILPEKIFVFLNRGDGEFGDLIEILGGGIREVSALTTKAEIKLLFGATGDINLDGSVDLVTTSGDYVSTGPVYAFLNRGDGTFVASSGIPAGDHAWIPALADLDNDGDLDLMTVDMDWETLVRTGEATAVLKVFLNTTVENQPTYVESAEEDKSPRTAGWSVLDQNYPNPFNAQTVITYDLALSGEVMVAIYDIQGRRVRILVREHQEPGRHSVMWDARDGEGKICSNGMYFYGLETEGVRHVKRMVLIK